jgi:dihydrofolate reductase
MLHDWMFDAATDEDRAILQEMLDGAGAVVMGRKSFDKNEGDGGWGDGGPLGDIPCFVLTHNKPARSHPPVFTFVTDGVASAIEQAKRAAGDKIVGLHGATVMQQALPLGLVDEIRVHVIPVLLGGGTPLLRSGHQPAEAGLPDRSAGLSQGVLRAPQKPHKSATRRPVPTGTPRTKRHTPVHLLRVLNAPKTAG